MPVTIVPGEHQPKLHPTSNPPKTWEAFLQIACSDFCDESTQIWSSSIASRAHVEPRIYPSSSNLLRAAVEAWGRHSHLTIRPDDVWFTILVQLNFFMKKNGESLRHMFVKHQGKTTLTSKKYPDATAIQDLCKQTQCKVKTPWLWDWIRPGFSTSEEDDEVTACALMMGTMQSYFDYRTDIICGIPSVTLLGCKEDWHALLGKLDRLPEFGTEPTQYSQRLRPLLVRMMASFDNPWAPDIREFWNQMVHAKAVHTGQCDLPPKEYVISGWLVGLFYWTVHGSPSPYFAKAHQRSREMGKLQYDGIEYSNASLDAIPAGYASIPLEVCMDDVKTECWIIAGGIGKRIVHGAPFDYHGLATQDPRDESCQKPQVALDPKSRRKRIIQSTWTRPVVPDDTKTSVVQLVKHKSRSETHMDESIEGHSAIQPVSGWFVIGPRIEYIPRNWDEEELDGPTVEAIESCTADPVMTDMKANEDTRRRTLNALQSACLLPVDLVERLHHWLSIQFTRFNYRSSRSSN